MRVTLDCRRRPSTAFLVVLMLAVGVVGCGSAPPLPHEQATELAVAFAPAVREVADEPQPRGDVHDRLATLSSDPSFPLPDGIDRVVLEGGTMSDDEGSWTVRARFEVFPEVEEPYCAWLLWNSAGDVAASATERHMVEDCDGTLRPIPGH